MMYSIVRRRNQKNAERRAQLSEKRGGVLDTFPIKSSIDKNNNRYSLKEPSQSRIRAYKTRALTERKAVVGEQLR